MAIKFFAELENTDKFLSVVGGLYSRHNLGAQQKRYVDLYLSHKNNFSVLDCDFFSSSGRIEVLGNHTDHNNGKVLAAAISLDTLACVTKTDDNYIKILSGGYPIFIVNVDKVLASEKERGTSVALVKGVCNWFKENDYKVGGFVATMVSDVIKGAGVSSSASFEVLIAEILNVLYNDGKMSAIEKAVASQYAEYFYFGKPCGLLDQSAIALGDVSYIDFKDPLKMQVKNYDLPFDDLDIVIVNAGGDHSDLTAN
ncbi:MAG: galactokinase, partial [Faecalibacterium sp.]|nr:galactokinase [Faecalibacterium sp.]